MIYEENINIFHGNIHIPIPEMMVFRLQNSVNKLFPVLS